MSGYPSINIPPSPVRRKTEAYWSGLTGRTFASDTDVNLVDFLKALPPPSAGTLAPFFNVTSNKLNVFNDNVSLAFKINLTGSWSGSSTRRSMQLDFLGTNGNRLVASRDEGVTSDVITLATFFSVDKNGSLVTNGSTPVIRSNGGTFTVTAILLIAEQVTFESSISAI
jgi:hypothetical protein